MPKNKHAFKINFVFSYARLVLFLTIVSLSLISLVFSQQIENVLNVSTEQTKLLDHNGLQVHFVDVGQGDAIVLELPDGKNMLIDAGPSGNASKLIDYIDNNVFENLPNSYFDYVLITHSDTDHIGGMDEIFDEYQINYCYRPRIYATEDNFETVPQGAFSTDTATYKKVIERVVNEPACVVEFSSAGLQINGGSGLSAYSIKFLTPMQDYYDNANEFSPILLVEYLGKTIMLTGDATIFNEQQVLSSYSLPKIDVLKLGHHGSSSSTGQQLLEVIDVTYAIISAGSDNRYNHPDQETINRLIYSGVLGSNIFATDNNGNIIANVTTSGQLNMFTDVINEAVFIEWEVIVVTIIMIGFSICFIKQKTKS